MAKAQIILGELGGGALEYDSQIPTTLNTEYTLQMKNGMFVMGSDLSTNNGSAKAMLIIIDGVVIYNMNSVPTEFVISYANGTITYKMAYNYTSADRGAMWVKLD